MYQKIRKQNEGFTIIEVLIVLAIAGLIILIVFLAVPALQRNSRNTQRRNDVATLLGLITESASNSGGQLPTQAFCFGEMIVNRGTGTPNTTAPGGYYCRTAGTSISWDNTATTNNTTTDQVVMRSGAVCTAAGDATTSGASARNSVALYTLEIGTKQCQQQ